LLSKLQKLSSLVHINQLGERELILRCRGLEIGENGKAKI
jgi:hypothetical protein